MTRASAALLWFTMAIVASIGLYPTSYRVETLERQLRKLNAEIEMEQQNIHVLKAEWVYLTNPVRIAEAAKKHLNLQPTAISQIAKLEKLANVLPSREEAAAKVEVASTPIANVKTTLAARSTPQKIALADDVKHINTRLVIHGAGGDTGTRSEKASLLMADDGFTP